jgi:hypothetical protein
MIPRRNGRLTVGRGITSTLTSSIDQDQLNRFHLETETESVSETLCVLIKNRRLDSTQKHNKNCPKPFNFICSYRS